MGHSRTAGRANNSSLLEVEEPSTHPRGHLNRCTELVCQAAEKGKLEDLVSKPTALAKASHGEDMGPLVRAVGRIWATRRVVFCRGRRFGRGDFSVGFYGGGGGRG